MDINELLQHQQIERALSENAQSDTARRAHAGLARRFEDEIRRATDGRVNIRPVQSAIGERAL
jgi:hypothetical protein